MFRRTSSIIAMLMIVMLVALPLASASDAATGDDGASDGIVITVQDRTEDGDAYIEIGAGGSGTLTVYVYNSSDSYLSMSSRVDTGADLGCDIAQSATMLLPEGVSESGHVATVDVTISVDRYESNASEHAELVLSFADLADSSSTFTVTLGIEVGVSSLYYTQDGENRFMGVFENTFDGFMGSEWFTALVTLVIWVLIAFVACIIVIPLFARIFAGKSTTDENKRIKRNLTSLAVVLMAVLAINQCLGILGVSAELREGFNTLSGILYIVIGALMAWTVYVFVVTAILRGVERGTDSGFDSSLIPLFKMIGKIAIAVVAVGSVLAIFGVDLNGILVSAGVVTLGITLGAQNILNQFFSGIVLLSTRPFKKGDFVNIGGEVYIVRKVKLMFTEFDNWDMDQVVTIPNDVVSGGTIVNMTGEDSEARTYVYVNVAYGADLKRAQELMIQAADEHPHVIRDGSRSKPSTRLTNVGNSTVEIRLAAYVDDFDSSGGYAGELRGRIIELFTENGIEMPHDRLEVSLE